MYVYLWKKKSVKLLRRACHSIISSVCNWISGLHRIFWAWIQPVFYTLHPLPLSSCLESHYRRLSLEQSSVTPLQLLQSIRSPLLDILMIPYFHWSGGFSFSQTLLNSSESFIKVMVSNVFSISAVIWSSTAALLFFSASWLWPVLLSSLLDWC